MTLLDRERDRTKNTKGRYQRVKPRTPSKDDYNWENPGANRGAPYAWENSGAARDSNRHSRLTALNQPMNDGNNPLRIFFNIFGRLNRAAYTKRWVALLVIGSIPLAILEHEPVTGQAATRSGFTLSAALVVFMILYIAIKALQIRRLHDLGLSSIWLGVTIAVDAGLIYADGGLWYVCVVLAVLYNFIFLYFYGTFGPNKYGHDPILRELGDSDPFTSSSFGWYKQFLLADVIRLAILLFFRSMILLFAGY